jgi:DNA (cytosine-5)-methyltransferase 1
MIKVVELFSGVGSQRMALDRLDIDFEVVGISEIDKYALQSYEAIHGDCPNLGDITKINPEDVPEHDLLTYSFPCQDISIAGKMQGLKKGGDTRSGLLWEVSKIIKQHRPKYLLLENVKNLVGKQFKPDFDKWLQWLDKQGYVNYYDVLNAKDYGIPQNRERVFVVSIRKDVNAKRTPYEIGFFDNITYNFPKPIELKLKLKDMLEEDVDEKYYINQEKIKNFIKTSKNKNKIGELNFYNFNQEDTVWNIKNIAPTITASGANSKIKILIKDKIRILTPLECWRLMGFGDRDFKKAQDSGLSDTQLYKQAGNSIVVDVLVKIFKELFKEVNNVGNWGISENASEKEKIKSEMADYLNGLNSTGEIDYRTYCELFDYSMELFEKIYILGKQEVNNENN